jgi:hypothetical protein
MLLSLRARLDTGSTEQLVPTTLGPGGILFLWSRCIVREEGVEFLGFWARVLANPRELVCNMYPILSPVHTSCLDVVQLALE